MPGWYVHLEAAHDTARAMRDGNIPPGFAITATEAQVIGEHCRLCARLAPSISHLHPRLALCPVGCCMVCRS